MISRRVKTPHYVMQTTILSHGVLDNFSSQLPLIPPLFHKKFNILINIPTWNRISYMYIAENVVVSLDFVFPRDIETLGWCPVVISLTS